MQEEHNVLQANHTQAPIKPSPQVKIVGNKWEFRIKYNSDGSVSMYKARRVTKAFHQTYGVDYSETFSSIVKASTVRIVLSLAVMYKQVIRQVNVNNAFFNGILLKMYTWLNQKGLLTLLNIIMCVNCKKLFMA